MVAHHDDASWINMIHDGPCIMHARIRFLPEMDPNKPVDETLPESRHVQTTAVRPGPRRPGGAQIMQSGPPRGQGPFLSFHGAELLPPCKYRLQMKREGRGDRLISASAFRRHADLRLRGSSGDFRRAAAKRPVLCAKTAAHSENSGPLSHAAHERGPHALAAKPQTRRGVASV